MKLFGCQVTCIKLKGFPRINKHFCWWEACRPMWSWVNDVLTLECPRWFHRSAVPSRSCWTNAPNSGRAAWRRASPFARSNQQVSAGCFHCWPRPHWQCAPGAAYDWPAALVFQIWFRSAISNRQAKSWWNAHCILALTTRLDRHGKMLRLQVAADKNILLEIKKFISNLTWHIKTVL